MNNKNNLIHIVLISLYVALLVVSSYISIPLPFSTSVITLHTVVINIIALTLKPKHSILCIIIYLFMGLTGLPVFALGTPGISRLFSPVGGYYLGFLISTLIMNILNNSKLMSQKYIPIMLLVGLPIQHLCAIFVMLFYNSFDLVNAFLVISLPFIFGDIVKIFISYLIIKNINKIKKVD